jgi:predicted transcriptional regulator
MPTWEPVNADPLDLRNPTPEFRAPGDTPELTTLPDAPESPLIELGLSQVAKNRQAFIDRLTSEDQDLRVMATALKLRGYSVQTIADGLDVSVARVRRVLKQARTDGNLADVLADLTTEALPLAVEKLIEQIDKGEEWAIKETLKGTGAFRRYAQQDQTAQRDERQLQVNFIMPALPTALNPKGVVGSPRGPVPVIDIVGTPETPPETP